MSSKITLLPSDLAWHIAGALGLRIYEIVYGVQTRSGLALALTVYSVPSSENVERVVLALSPSMN